MRQWVGFLLDVAQLAAERSLICGSFRAASAGPVQFPACGELGVVVDLDLRRGFVEQRLSGDLALQVEVVH